MAEELTTIEPTPAPQMEAAPPAPAPAPAPAPPPPPPTAAEPASEQPVAVLEQDRQPSAAEVAAAAAEALMDGLASRAWHRPSEAATPPADDTPNFDSMNAAEISDWGLKHRGAGPRNRFTI